MDDKFILPVNYDSVKGLKRKAVREQYVEEQKNKCWFCKSDLGKEPHKTKWINLRLFPPGFMKNPIHLHHSHDSGMTIGAVHAYCNAVLWQYEGS